MIKTDDTGDLDLKKWMMTAAYIAVVSAVIYNKEVLIVWLKKGGDPSDIPLIIILATLLALVPVIPFGVIAGIAGVKYGVWIGGLINVVSSTAASVVMFFVVRYVFAEFGRSYLTKQKALRQFTLMVEKNAFFSVLLGRLIPILPSPAVNVYAAISKIPFMTFLGATILGKIPVMLVFAFVGDQAFESIKSSLFALGIYAVILLVVFIGYRYHNKQKFKSRID